MRQRITTMLTELQQYKSPDKLLMQQLIQKRLDKSFDLYYAELEKSLQLLSKKHEKSLLKRINKLDDKTN